MTEIVAELGQDRIDTGAFESKLSGVEREQAGHLPQ
jgi:hypothetical protein